MTRLLFASLLLLMSSCTFFDQRYFEGEIHYTITYDIKNPADTSVYIAEYPARGARMLFKEGSWLRFIDSAKDYSFSYFDRTNNRECWKLKHYDTLIYFPASERGGAKEDSIISLQILPHADTVLDRVCNRLVLRTHAMKLSLSFDPQLRIDPTWFTSAKMNYYDVVYGKTGAMHLKVVWETKRFTVTNTATSIQQRIIDPKEFEVASALPAILAQ